MKLRQKTLLILGGTLLSLIVAIAMIVSTVTLRSFAELERQNTRSNIDRAINALDTTLENMESLVIDYSQWDDSYEFVGGEFDDYRSENLDDYFHAAFDLDLLLFIDTAGQMVYGYGYDFEVEETLELSPEVRNAFGPGSPYLFGPDSGVVTRTGIASLPDGPVLFVAGAVLPSFPTDEDVTRGTMIMIRNLDDEVLDEISDRTRLSLSAYDYEADNLPADVQEARQQLTELDTVAMPLDSQVVAGYVAIDDIFGQPALILRVDKPRSIYQQGQRSVSLSIVALIIAGVMLSALAMILLETSVLKRLTGLSSRVRRIAAEGDPSARVAGVNGRDELSQLAGDINGMLGRLEQRAAEHEQMLSALRRSEERYALMARGTNDGLWDWDVQSGEVFYSARWRSVLGYPHEEVLGDLEVWLGQIHPEDSDRVRSNLEAHLAGESAYFECEHRLRAQDGGYRWVLCRGAAVTDAAAKPVRVAGSLTDLNQLGVFDALTGLPNRILLLNSLGHALARSKRRPDRISALLFMDINDFKVVNDGLGHNVGDELLIELARRLKYCVRSEDTVARWGGDEFAILLEDVADEGALIKIVDRIRRYLTFTFESGGQTIFNSFSMGVVADIRAYDGTDTILRDADIAMYESKQSNVPWVRFDQPMFERASVRQRLEVDLRNALQNDEFFLEFQPIISLADGAIRGFEALVRWRHPERGIISPGEFIPLAEETGLIISLGDWVLHRACRQMKAWLATAPAADDLVMSVNLSSRQLEYSDLVATVSRTLQRTGLEPARLELEITESAVIENPAAVEPVLNELKELGVGIAMDDFGTGYSSLSYLHQLPIDTLKIDRSFVAKMTDDPATSAIVRTIAELARSLRLKVTAEGIETAEQLRVLRGLDCHYGQGYLFSRPVAFERAATLTNFDVSVADPVPLAAATLPG